MIDSLALIVLLSPIAFFLASLTSFIKPGIRPRLVKRSSSLASLVSFPVAAIAIWMIAKHGQIQSPMVGWEGIGLSIRIDPLSVVMLTMIILLAYIIVRFSHQYLEGDQRHGIFLGRLCATIAAVEIIVLSGNLGILILSWIATSLSLHSLLVFYSHRPGSVIAGFKKFIAARTGDVCLISASILLYLKFGTGNLESIFDGAHQYFQTSSGFGSVEGAAVLLAIAALLKSAQFPTHGWLVEVMETPTPVSALLHAGILNAGPFLIARMAYVVDGSSIASALLIILGGFTALFSSTVLLTQPAIKVALGYSSVAHMGFMLLVCGLGVYPAAILHLVAHSFYKAHAFLSSGSVVDEGKAQQVPIPSRRGQPLRVALSVILAVGIYLGFTQLWGIDPTQKPAQLAVGIILVMGLAQIIAPALDSFGGLKGTFKAMLLAISVATHFFVLETLAHKILYPVMPHGPTTDTTTLVSGAIMLSIFAAAVLIQIFGPRLYDSPLWKRFGIHFRKGLYANALFDRLVGAFDKDFRENLKNVK